MNPVFDTECSAGGGCESGWTLYLNHDSFLSSHASHKSSNEYFMTDEQRGKHKEDDEEEEEDLSMVSDASSGPPHFHEDEDYGNDNNNGLFYHTPVNSTLPKNNGKRQKNKENRRRKLEEQQLSFLDDTASSPIFDFSSNNLALTNSQASMETTLDYSQGHSTTQFEGKSRFQEHYGFFQSPVSGAQLQQNQWFERKKVG